MRGVVATVAFVAAFLLQIALLPALGVGLVAPDMIFAVLIPVAVLWEPVPAALMGTGVGLLMDIYAGHGIGLYSISYLVVGWAAGAYGGQFYRENAFIPAGMAAGAVALREILVLTAIYLGRMHIAITWGYVLRVLASALITAGLTIPWHLWLYSWTLRFERRKPGMFYLSRGRGPGVPGRR